MQAHDTTAPSAGATILAVRALSRKLVRQLGFMRSTLADTDLAPSAVHAVLEIGAAPGITARDLGHLLRLDKSNTSRQLARLEARGLVRREPVDEDARAFALSLTPAGQSVREDIDRFATTQVAKALRHMSSTDQALLVRALGLYAEALAQDADAIAPSEAVAPALEQGYQPGCIGDIAALHARFYAEHWGFGIVFERKVATELAAFASTLPAEGKRLWLYRQGGRTLASLVIDGDPATGVAHLRWFIVDAALRGTGMGRHMMDCAMQYVDQHFDQTYLWTFKGLDAARHLYASFGFTLTHESPGEQWGKSVIEQRLERRRGGSALAPAA